MVDVHSVDTKPIGNFAAFGLRMLYVSYVAFATGSTGIYLIALSYAKSHDPWLTPRRTDYMMIYWDVAIPMLGLMTLLVPIGIVLLIAIPGYRRRYSIRFAIGTMAVLIALHVIR